MDIDQKIEKAMNDEDIVNIMHKASNKFTNYLDEDIIYTCHLNALWKCFLNFDPNRNTKFTTYLYRGVFIECVKEVKFQNKMQHHQPLHANMIASGQPSIMMDIMDELDNDEERSLMIDKYANLTIEEIANKRSYSRETARKRLKKIYKKVKNNFE